MRRSLKQEFYKFRHQRTPLYGAVALLVLMLYSAISKSNVTKDIIAQSFGSGQWITIIMITIASTFVAMEYQNNTIILLFYKSSHKLELYVSKLLVILTYGVELLIMSVIITFTLKFLLVRNKYGWFQHYQQSTILNVFFLNLLGTVIYLSFVVTLAFLLISLFKNNAVVIGLGLATVFLGSTFSSLVMSTFTGLIPFMKWNPFNMIYIVNQLADSKEFAKFSYLNNSQLVTANLVYIIMFIVVGYLLFRKRRV